MSVTVLQPLKISRVAQRAENCETRFMYSVKWVLLRCKSYRDMITPMGRIRIIETAVVFGPLFVSGTCTIRDEIISSWLFADPKDCCYDICFPRKRPRASRGGRFSDGLVCFGDRFDLTRKGRIKRDEESETKKAK